MQALYCNLYVNMANYGLSCPEFDAISNSSGFEVMDMLTRNIDHL